MPLLNLKPIIRFSLWITVFVYLIQTATTTTPWLLKFKGKFYLPALHVPNEIQLAINHPLGYDNPYSKSLIATHGWAWSSPLATHPYIIEKSNLKLKNPDRQHWLGTDHLGRDCFGLMLQGLASALSFGLIYSLVCLSLGTGIGLIAGFYPNGYDRAIQSFLVIWKSIPLLYLLIILRAWLPLTKHQVLLVMVAFGWGKFYQLTRALALQNRQGIYMLSCRSLGFKPWRLLLYHLFPLSLYKNAAHTLTGIYNSGESMTVLAKRIMSLHVTTGNVDEYVTVAWGEDFIIYFIWLLILAKILWSTWTRPETD